MRIIRHRTASAVFLTVALAACGGSDNADNSEGQDNALVIAANAQVANSDQTDASLQDEIDAVSWTESGGLPGCFDPSLSGRPRAVAERLGGVPCERDASSDNGGGASWPGEYEGPFDGGTGHVSISQAGNALAVDVSMFSDHGCGGSAEGRAQPEGNRLVLTMPRQDGAQCRITMTRQGSSLQVQEDGCSYFHGRSCEFTGSVTRQGGAVSPSRDTASTQPTGQGRPAWLFGAWAGEGEYCASGSPIVFEAGGGYRNSGGDTEGRWSASGSTLLIRFREVDPTTGQPVGQDRNEIFRLAQVNANEMRMDEFRFRRCSPKGGAEPWHPGERFTVD